MFILVEKIFQVDIAKKNPELENETGKLEHNQNTIKKKQKAWRKKQNITRKSQNKPAEYEEKLFPSLTRQKLEGRKHHAAANME